MISSAEIKRKAERQYVTFLSCAIAQAPFFPYELPIGKVPKDFMAMKAAVADLMAHSKTAIGYGYRLELETRKTRAYAEQSLPKRIYIESESDYLKLLKKEQEFSKFKSDVALIQDQMPALHHWMDAHPRAVVENHGIWPELLQVCQYFITHPRPNLYIRELPIPVHTKFVEQNKTVLRSLLEDLLPDEQLEPVEPGQKHVFEKRFSLKYPESLIRLRFLDLALQHTYGFQASDISLLISEFSQLKLGSPSCFITENLLPFLTLPALPNSIAILGGGYALNRLKDADWLLPCPIFYWGDMDSDGFRILSQLRSHLPQTQSIMMDIQTYERFQTFSVNVETESAEIPPHLTAEEQQLYAFLALHKKRLEQERIDQTYVIQRLTDWAN